MSARTTQRVVWKFPLRWGSVAVEMPKYARVLHVGMDPASEHPAVWALVNPEGEKVSRTFAVVGTGQNVPESVHVGSLIEGAFVWHIFEKLTEAGRG